MKNFNLDKFIETINNMRNPELSGYKTATFKTVRWTKYDRDRLYIKMCWRDREIDMGYIDLKDENVGYYTKDLHGEIDTISNRILNIIRDNITEEDETVEETVDEAVAEVADEADTDYEEVENKEMEINTMTIETLIKKGTIENEEEFNTFVEDREAYTEKLGDGSNRVDVRIDLVHEKLNCFAEITVEERVINEDGETECIYDGKTINIKFFSDNGQHDTYEDMLSELTTVFSENGDEIEEGTRMMASELFNMISEETIENNDLTVEQLIREETIVDDVGTYDRFGCGNGYKIPVKIEITFSVLEETEDDAEIFIETVSIEEA